MLKKIVFFVSFLLLSFNVCFAVTGYCPDTFESGKKDTKNWAVVVDVKEDASFAVATYIFNHINCGYENLGILMSTFIARIPCYGTYGSEICPWRSHGQGYECVSLEKNPSPKYCPFEK